MRFVWAGLLICPLLAGAEIPDGWTQAAFHLTAGARERREALAALRAVPDLDGVLRQALNGESRYLALDVITGLKREHLLPDVLRAAGRDPSGFPYLSVPGLIGPRTRHKVSVLLYRRLLDGQTSPTAKLILLDWLARLSVRVPAAELQLLLRDDSPEVQSAAISYVRHFTLYMKDYSYLGLLAHKLDSKALSMQRRAQLTAFLGELPRERRWPLASAKRDAVKPVPLLGLGEFSAPIPSCSRDVRLVFGYKDARPARFVGDRYERAFLVQELVRQGFVRSPDNDDLFFRDWIGRDGRRRTLRLIVANSSASPDDEENRRDPFQIWHSRYARSVFVEGLKSRGDVLYNGHSRTGGGPDFDPPVRTADQHVNYSWYQKHRPGLKLIESSLRPDGPGPERIALFACSSDAHFARSLSRVRPAAALTLSAAPVYYWDALQSSLKAVASLAAEACGP